MMGGTTCSRNRARWQISVRLAHNLASIYRRVGNQTQKGRPLFVIGCWSADCATDGFISDHLLPTAISKPIMFGKEILRMICGCLRVGA
jgi:hypothetical protein